jgi:hypothetical protein
MLLVTISNIDDTYHGVFDTDDKQAAAEAALANMVADQGFFPQNRIRTLPALLDRGSQQAALREDEDTYGILVIPEEEEECGLEYLAGSENTYWICIAKYKLGTMIAS